MITQEIPVHLVLNLIISCPFLAILPLSSPRYQWQTSTHGDVQSTIRTVFATSARITCPMASRNTGHVQSSWYVLMFSSKCFPPSLTWTSEETNDWMAHQSQRFGVKVLVRTQEMAGIPPRCFTSHWVARMSIFQDGTQHQRVKIFQPIAMQHDTKSHHFSSHSHFMDKYWVYPPLFWSIFTLSTWIKGYQLPGHLQIAASKAFRALPFSIHLPQPQLLQTPEPFMDDFGLGIALRSHCWVWTSDVHHVAGARTARVSLGSWQRRVHWGNESTCEQNWITLESSDNHPDWKILKDLERIHQKIMS